ncbi:hypothetical protein PVAND_001565 [Polypedilum vanderplanki]|uniref:Uncharacterized protein n=1 Tax=Polypedilum vanderplanki TaxID=319348 RepID=A0A9J6BNB6_POLVA|nr:hypothetical protein PVAND_001565 [Polypedilum vanderplanki]
MSFLKSKSDDVIITGIAGRFPKSRNVQEFASNLFNKIDMTDDSDERFKNISDDVPHRSGKISDLEKFDTSFFSILNDQAKYTDPQMRILLEHSYEAILDAGISPQTLIGSNTGVFVGCSASEAKNFYVKGFCDIPDQMFLTGNGMFYLANRISYTFGLCGPSLVLDSACSSASQALDCAYNYMKTGLCEAALVAGTNLIFTPFMFEKFNAMKILTNDGISKIFDEDSKGFVRAETISVIFLQNRKVAKRIYAHLVHSLSNNDGFKIEGSSLPSKKMQQKLMTKFYQDINFDPREIKFFEAHATGTKQGDFQEVNAIDAVLCQNRSDQLIIGSTKSNMGHSEAASGLASIAKILIAFENGKFPPNINLTKLRDDIPAFKENRIVVATDSIDLTSPYIAMNSFALGSSNVHLLFKQNTKEKTNQNQENEIERMVLWSGRTEEAIHSIFDDITSRPFDIEYIALLQNSQILTPDANSYRGFGIFKNDQENSISIDRNIQYFDGIRKKVVFVFAGMGTQWHGMGRDLMKVPLFAESIEESHEILFQKGINLKEILNSNEEKTFENVLNSYVGIVSIEIALTDVLFGLNIKPDFIVGHSVGEIACSYADGCLTREEALTIAYLRAKIMLDLNINGGAMVAVGMHFNELEKILSKEIDIACHNSQQSTTISGSKASIEKFTEQLKVQKIFVKEVACAGVPFHSRYMKDVGQELETKLKYLLKSSKIRSSKWITSTYIEDNEQNQLCDAKYHADNVRNPVYFEEATSKLPKNAITIEISPNGLFQSLLKSTLNENIYVSLTNKKAVDGKNYFMKSLGKIFQSGVDFNISKLYPTIDFPVSRCTPMISPIIKWNHQESHFVVQHKNLMEYQRRVKNLNFKDKELEYLSHHIIDGRVLVPATFWIVYIWKQFAKMHDINYESLRVTLKNVKISRATYVNLKQEIEIISTIHCSNGSFEIMEGKNLIASGIIERNENLKIFEIENQTYEKDSIVLTFDDFYKHLRVLGYQYLEKFKLVQEITDDGLKGKIKWKNNWVLFLDNIIQTTVLAEKYERVHLPYFLSKFSIDPILHKKLIEKYKGFLIPFERAQNKQYVRCGGAENGDFTPIIINQKQQGNLLVEFCKFISFENSKECFEIVDALKILISSLMDLKFKIKYNFIEINNDQEYFMYDYINKLFQKYPIAVNVKLWATEKTKLDDIEVINDQVLSILTTIDAVFTSNCIQNEALIEKIKNIHSNSVIISQENSNKEISNDKFEILSKLKLSNEKALFMLRFKQQKEELKKFKTIEITSETSDWLENLKEEIKNFSNNNFDSIILYSQKSKGISGLLGFFNCLRLEFNEINFKCFMIEDLNALKFDIDDPFYKNQLEKGFTVNVLKNNEWGSYRHIDLEEDTSLKPYDGHCFANYSMTGNLSTLKWFDGPFNEISEDDLIKVQYAALNFKDIVYAFGRIPDENCFMRECSIGFEFSGIRIKTGERVMGIVSRQGLSSYIKYNPKKTLNVPEDLTLEDAATIPMAYVTTFFSVFEMTKIEKGNSILIHSGAGAVGQAAIQIAFAYGLEVFTTVGTDEKREFLLKTFPKLKEENIGNSRDTSFLEMIMERTQNKGVDYVLNSLAGDKMIASLNCLGQNGIFLEIGRADLVQNTRISFNFIKKNISIKLVMVDKIDWASDQGERVKQMMINGFKERIIKPLTRTVFEANEIKKAFQHMSTGNHIGKILIKMRENEYDLSTIPINITSRFYCNSEYSYIVVGGLGGLGLEFSHWLIERKCRKLILSSSRGISNQYQAFKIKYWKSFGIEVIVNTSNVLTEAGCEKLIKTAMTLGPVGGIFNFAAVIRDAEFENHTIEDFNQSLAPKALATKFLHELSLKYCPMLKHFVGYSSIMCGRGYPGQTTYGMANSIMERIIEERYEMGLPAKVIQWGPIGDVGLLADVELNRKMKLNFEFPMQSLASFLEQHDILLNHPEPIVACTVIFNKNDKSTDEKKNFIEMLMEVLNIEDRKSISMSSTFSQLGIDSLAGIEIQQMIERNYGVLIESNELRNLTIFELDEKISKKTINNSLF